MVVTSEQQTEGVHHQERQGLLAPVIEPLLHRIDHERSENLLRRDPAFIRRQLSAVTRLVNLFSPEVRGVQNLPATGPSLVVGNHSCLFYMPDAWLVALEIIRRRGLEQPAYALAYDLLFGMPMVGPFLRRIGAIPADGHQAELALEQGALVLVYPGGDREACRPWTERSRIELGGHHGFVRLALRTGVPVVPVVTHGSHDAVVVVSRGDRLARALGLNRLRINVFPFLIGPPFGVTSVLAPPLPMPTAITVEFLPALDWSGYGSEMADDDAVVACCYEEITTTMQSALDRLHGELTHPVMRGWSNLVRRGPRRIEVPVR
jgi:1-acyl-sn-glycerol-3-phosphate acyltransferase